MNEEHSRCLVRAFQGMAEAQERQATAMERQAKAQERQADAMEKLAGLAMDAGDGIKIYMEQ